MPQPASTASTNQYLHRPSRAAVVLVLALTALVLSGCESIMVMTGARMRLDGVPLQSIAASMPGNGGLAPGASAPLSIVATTTDGRTLATAGTGDGKVLPDSYTFEASLAAVSAKGVVSLPDDPRLLEAHTPHVRIVAAGTTAPATELDIPVRYDVPFTATYAGADGMGGTDGFDGSPAGTAGDVVGGDGGDGGNGSDGRPAPEVRLWVALEPGAHPLLRVRASEAGHDHFFLVDPEGGSLAIAVRGGRGGPGGAGGKGGAMDPDSKSVTFAGQDGQDGSPGRGGAAGQVTLTIDPAAAPYLDRLHITNVDGDGHAGSAPAVTIAPVASPW
jgi:hypothetical protein